MMNCLIEPLEGRILLSREGWIGHWSFDEGEGLVASDNACLELHASLTSGPTWIEGVVGGAVRFDGGEGRAVVDNVSELNPAGAITVAAWMRPERVGTQYPIKKAAFGSIDGYELSLSSAGRFFVRFNQASSGNAYRLDSVTPYPTDGLTWVHVAATYDGTTISLYVNGMLNASTEASFTINSNKLPLTLGGEWDNMVFPYTGAIDELHVVGRALTADEVAELVLQAGVEVPQVPDGEAISLPGLAGYWSLDEASGTTALDRSGHNLHGTVTAGADWTTGIVNSAMRFSAPEGRVLIPNAPELNPTNAITIAAWLRPNQTATQYAIKKAEAGTIDGYELSLSSAGQFYVRFNQPSSGNAFRLESATPYPADGQTWTHVAATYDGSTIRLYINGVLDASREATFTIAGNDLPLGLGGEWDNTVFPYSGALDEVYIFNRALSAMEVSELAAATTSAPFAAWSGPGSITSAGGTEYIFTVTYSGPAAIDVATLGSGDILVTGPNGFSQLASLVSVDDSDNGSPTATYRINAPGETWSHIGNGTYVIAMRPGQVADVDGSLVPAGTLGTFTVNIAGPGRITIPGVVGYWPLDERWGVTAFDHSIYGLHGSVTRGTTWIDGLTNGAVRFDGQGGRVLIADAPQLNPVNAITMAAWLKPEQVGNQQVIKKAQTGSINGYELVLSSTGRVYVRFNQATAGNNFRLESTSLYPSDGQTWIHAAATYDGTTIRLYVNGVLEAEKAASFSISPNSLPLSLGGEGASTNSAYMGAMDEVYILNRALSAAEVAALMQGTLAAGFVHPLNPMPISQTTGEKPQSKVWEHDGYWWAVLPNQSGTYVWRLDGNTWTEVLLLTTSTSVQADVKSIGDIAHVLMFDGVGGTKLASIQYLAGSPPGYMLWPQRPQLVDLPLSSGAETATIAVDGLGRMWVAWDGDSTVFVRYSDSPYLSWSNEIALATGLDDDDIVAITALPNQQIGVFWSNQNTQRFGFRVRNDADHISVWGADEVPASQSALPVGGGMADDHINFAVHSDGTLFVAVKTEYDTPGYPMIALLVRRPSGVWDPLHTVDMVGTRPIVLLDESAQQVMVVYTGAFGTPDNIVFKVSSLPEINFGPLQVLIPGTNNNVTSTRASFSGEVVILASHANTLTGVRYLTAAAAQPATQLVSEPNDTTAAPPQHHPRLPVSLTPRGVAAATLVSNRAWDLVDDQDDGDDTLIQQEAQANIHSSDLAAARRQRA